MTLDERSAYQAWHRHGENAAAMTEMERVWRSLDIAQHNCAKRQTEIIPVRRRGNAARSTLVAAMCVVSLGIGVLSYSSDSGFWTNLDWTDR
jgi:ferric-dicitrate binding protein FerR (iron transport regulator)